MKGERQIAPDCHQTRGAWTTGRAIEIIECVWTRWPAAIDTALGRTLRTFAFLAFSGSRLVQKRG